MPAWLGKLAWHRPHYARYEWLVMRFGMAWLVWQTVRNPPALAEQPSPIGLAHYMDLTWIGQVPQWNALALVMLGLYALGWFPLLSTGTLLAMHVFIGTLVNSQGAIHHTTQIVGYLLLAQFMCHLWHGCCQREHGVDPRALGRRLGAQARDPLRWLGEKAAPGTRANDWVWYSLQITAAVYVVCGVSKLLRSGFDWVREIPNIPLQFEKNQLMWYYNTLEEQATRTSEFAVRMTIEHPVLAQGFFSAGLLLELTAFLILFRRWLALLWGIGLFMLHHFVTELMNLQFILNKTALILLLVNIPFWLVAAWWWLRSRKRDQRSGGAESDEAPVPAAPAPVGEADAGGSTSAA